MTDAVQTERRGAVLEIVIDRPKANAIDAATSRRLGEIFAGFRDDRELRVAIVTAAGDKFFSAGWDLKAAAGGEAQDYGVGGFAGLTELFDLRKPVIAAVNGMAVGGGFELALACDLIVAADRATFFLPEVNIGLIPDAGGVLRLPRRLPRAIAMEMLLTGSRLDAADAYRLGLVNRVVSGSELHAAARELADRIVAAAPLSIAAVKEVIAVTEHLPIDQAYAAMRTGQAPAYDRLLASEDTQEGPRAFAEKRPPVWRGR
ncbi:enoyl-CoA hydratase-related protein [Rhodospirillaceae bacterium SYSU D60014]|uniref:enoyl-CoA hydratase-related protein n=1 Tax=Virgifigura deserti TaxID=2268457 RepID=UPI000E667909